MALRIALIIDKSEAFVNFQKEKLLKEWGVEPESTRAVQNPLEAGEASLFGAPPLAILTFDMKDKASIQAAQEVFAKASKEALARMGNPGLIMLIPDADRRNTSKLEKAVSAAGGILLLAKESSSDKTPVAQRLVDELDTTREVKNFLRDYAGDDYSSILSIVKALGSLPAPVQKKITVEDVLLRIPTPPGGIPPWELEKPLFSGDFDKALELFRRIAATSHFLVPLSILKNKFFLAWRAANLLQSNPRLSQADIATILNEKNGYPLKLAIGHGERYGVDKLAFILERIATTEAKVKGGSAGSGMVFMEILLADMHNTLHRG